MKKTHFVLIIYLLIGLLFLTGCGGGFDGSLSQVENETEEERQAEETSIPNVTLDEFEKDPLAGEPLVPKLYEELDNMFGYVDIEGRVAIEPQYEEASIFSEGLAFVKKGGKGYIINTNGEEVAEITDEGFNDIFNLYVDKFIDGYIWFRDSDFSWHGPNHEHYGLINTRGEVAWYPNVYPFSEGVALVMPNSDQLGLRYFMDGKGNYITDVSDTWEPSASFREGLIWFQETENGPYGFMDKSGEYVIKPQFEDVKSFFNGVAGATLDGELWGYIDHDGNWVIEPQFEIVSKFIDGYAVVDDRYLIDKSANVLVDCKEKGFDEIYFYSEGFYGAKQGRNWGYLDSDLNWLIELGESGYLYAINPCKNGLICVERHEDEQNYYNSKGVYLGSWRRITLR